MGRGLFCVSDGSQWHVDTDEYYQMYDENEELIPDEVDWDMMEEDIKQICKMICKRWPSFREDQGWRVYDDAKNLLTNRLFRIGVEMDSILLTFFIEVREDCEYEEFARWHLPDYEKGIEEILLQMYAEIWRGHGGYVRYERDRLTRKEVA